MLVFSFVSFVSAGESAAAFRILGEFAETEADSEQATPLQTVISNTSAKSERFIGISFVILT
jgi:hypothetical protein